MSRHSRTAGRHTPTGKRRAERHTPRPSHESSVTRKRSEPRTLRAFERYQQVTPATCTKNDPSTTECEVGLTSENQIIIDYRTKPSMIISIDAEEHLTKFFHDKNAHPDTERLWQTPNTFP